jgi:hypothetical protein
MHWLHNSRTLLNPPNCRRLRYIQTFDLSVPSLQHLEILYKQIPKSLLQNFASPLQISSRTQFPGGVG